MYEDNTDVFLLAGLACIVLLVTILSVVSPPSTISNIHNLGDEVTTTDRYTELFNDSFSGHVVTTMADGLYTVRDENGTERTFERTWLDHIDDGGDI